MPGDKNQQIWSIPRAHTRFLLDIRLVLRGRELMSGRTKDLSEGGMGATIPGSIEISEIVEIEFQLPLHNEPIRLKAEVRYRQGFQYGFRFLHTSEQQRAMIRRATRDLPVAP